MPIGLVVASSLMISRVLPAVHRGWHSAPGHALLLAVVGVGVFFAALQMLTPLAAVLATAVARRIDGVIRDRLAAAGPDRRRPALSSGRMRDRTALTSHQVAGGSRPRA